MGTLVLKIGMEWNDKKKVVWRRNKNGNKSEKNEKNNTKDSNVVPHRSTNLAR